MEIRIKLRIGKKEIELELTEAIELKDKLLDIFGGGDYTPIYVPTYTPTYIPNYTPYSPYEPYYKITCDNTVKYISQVS